MKDWAHLRKTDFLARITRGNRRLKTYLQNLFDRSAGLGPTYLDAWDFPLTYHLLKKGLLTAFPHTNLVANLGLGHPAAVNTKASRLLPEPQPLPPELPPPPFIYPNLLAEVYSTRAYWNPPPLLSGVSPHPSRPGLWDAVANLYFQTILAESYSDRTGKELKQRDTSRKGVPHLWPPLLSPRGEGARSFSFLAGETSGSGAMAGHHQPYLQPHCRPSRDQQHRSLYSVLVTYSFVINFHPNHGIRP